MSKNFSANQYEGAFKSNHLQNWEIPKTKVEKRPNKYVGFSVFNANDSGHLLDTAARSKKSSSSGFVGTWDMPKKIPGNNVLNTMARHPSSAKNLKIMKEEFDKKVKPRSIINVVEQSTKAKKETGSCNSENDAEMVLAEKVPDSKSQTPKTPLNEKYTSPSLNKVTVPTPLGLQDPDATMKSSRPTSEEFTEREMSLKQGVNFKDPEEASPKSGVETQKEKPSTPLQDSGRMNVVKEHAPVQTPCSSQRSMWHARGPAPSINWPAPKALS